MLERIAQEIVDLTSEIIHFDALITDQNSIVIGCSDLSRIGTFHQASQKLMLSKQSLVSHSEHQVKNLVGVKPGITMPIELDGEIIGTIGITGNPEDVHKFAILAKKYAEIILREELINDLARRKRQAIESLLHEISIFNPGTMSEKELTRNAYELGINLTLKSQIIAIEISQENYIGDTNDYLIMQDKLKNILDRFFSNPQALVASLATNKFTVLYRLQEKSTNQQCEQLAKLLTDNKIQFKIGIGSEAQTIIELKNSLYQAWKAVELGKIANPLIQIYSIENLHLENLISMIPTTIQKNYKSTFGALFETQGDMAELYRTICTWCECGFNLSTTSKKLSIHKNTLLYRLNRLEELFLINPRNYKEMINVYLAIKMHELDHPSLY